MLFIRQRGLLRFVKLFPHKRQEGVFERRRGGGGGTRQT